MKLFFVLAFLCFCSGLNAQNKKNTGFFSSFELGYQFKSRGSVDFGAPGDTQRIKFAGNEDGISIKSLSGWHLNEKYALGLGIGIESVTELIPVTVELRRYFKDARNTYFVYLDFGRSIQASDMNKLSAWLVSVGYGYKFFISKKTCLAAGFRYQYTWYDFNDTYYNILDMQAYQAKNMLLKNLSFRIAVLF